MWTLCVYAFMFFRAKMDTLYELFFMNLEDCISSVRQGAAQALSNVVKAYGLYDKICVCRVCVGGGGGDSYIDSRYHIIIKNIFIKRLIHK